MLCEFLILMLATEPSQILEPRSTLGNFSIQLDWETPEYADLCIVGYRISGWMDDDKDVEALSVSTAEKTVLFEKDLVACQAYTIQIIPYTKQNLDGELRQIEVETKAAVVNMDKVNKFNELQEMNPRCNAHVPFTGHTAGGGQWYNLTQFGAECEQSGLRQQLPDLLCPFQLLDHCRCAPHVCREICGEPSRGSWISGTARTSLTLHLLHMQCAALQCGRRFQADIHNGTNHFDPRLL